MDGLIARKGVEKIGFLTLTFSENLTCRRESQRRFNSFATHFLRTELAEHIATVERQQRGAIHYHLVSAFDYDIRSGFDFENCSKAGEAKRAGDQQAFKAHEKAYIASANPNLRAWWKRVRETAPAYGFGRCETLPILSNSQALARYVGSYVTSESMHREPRDRGMRTVRYSLERRVASIRWQWSQGQGKTWRQGCACLGAILQTDDFTWALGERWAWNWRDQIALMGQHWEVVLAVIDDYFQETAETGQNLIQHVGPCINGPLPHQELEIDYRLGLVGRICEHLQNLTNVTLTTKLTEE